MELVSRSAAGDWVDWLKREARRETEEAFVSLVERRARFVFQVAYAVLRNVEDAEDVAQDTFSKLFRSGAWKQMEDEKAFLARTAWRLAIGKKSARRVSVVEVPVEMPSLAEGPEDAVLASERRRMVHKLMDTLPEKLRGPLALSSNQELSTAEIAAVLELPEGTVRRLLVEARAMLKEKILRLEGRGRG